MTCSLPAKISPIEGEWDTQTPLGEPSAILSFFDWESSFHNLPSNGSKQGAFITLQPLEEPFLPMYVKLERKFPNKQQLLYLHIEFAWKLPQYIVIETLNY